MVHTQLLLLLVCVQLAFSGHRTELGQVPPWVSRREDLWWLVVQHF